MWWDYCPGQLVSIALVTRLGWPPRTKERTSALAEKAKTLAGWKAYATNSEPATADFVIGSYHQLWRIEKSFRMSKSDLAGRPIFHRLEGSIRAHLTIVFAALAITRIVEARTGWSIKKFVTTARRYRTIEIQAAGQTVTAADPLPDDLAQALRDLAPDVDTNLS